VDNVDDVYIRRRIFQHLAQYRYFPGFRGGATAAGVQPG
jgi:hypothetical protein